MAAPVHTWRQLGLHPGTALTHLTPLLTTPRVHKLLTHVRSRIHHVSLLLDGVANPRNVGAACRTAEGLGVHNVDMACLPEAYDLALRSQSATRWLATRRFESGVEALEAPPHASLPSRLKEERPLVITAELSQDARHLEGWREELEAAVGRRERRTVLVFGNERNGVSKEVSAMADGAFILPMRGLTQSYNISVAVSMTLATLDAWGILRPERGDPIGGGVGDDDGLVEVEDFSDLTEGELAILADWVSNSVPHAGAVLTAATAATAEE